jgi:hypothetical protein
MVSLNTASRIALALSLATAPALAGDGHWNYGVGLTYASGLKDVKDFYEKEYNAYSVTISPVGLVFMPSYEWKNGFMICADLGPTMLAMGDISYTDVPVGLGAGFVFMPTQNISPYIRAGIRHHIANGDNVEESKTGAFAALGLEFSRKSSIHWGFEAAIDTSVVKFKSSDQIYNPVSGTYGDVFTDIKPNKFMLNVHVAF